MSRFSASLRAYPTLLQVGLSEAIAYRAEMIVWMLTTTMPLVSLALWSSVAESGPIGPFTQRGFVSYFLATLVVRQLTGSWLVWILDSEIRSGVLGTRLLKPIHPLLVYSAQNLAALPLRASLTLPVAVIAVLTFEPGALPTSPLILAVWLLSLLGAWLINFFIMALIGSLAFFMERSTSVFDLWLAAFMILSGYLIPLDLFPPFIRSITHALPFRYTLAFPVELITGSLRGQAIFEALAIQWAYVLGISATALAVWRAGVGRYSAYGG
ncbi:MAG: ABC-2 family transporter protein [Byssovorax sp.]